MNRYEYKMVQLGKPKDRQELLDKLGSQGWELIEIKQSVMYFKREKRDI